MYYVFKSELQAWRNEIVQARIEGRPPLPKPHWWECVPLNPPLPMLRFKVPNGMPLLDNLFSGTQFELYSTDMVRLMSKAGVQFETFPALVVDESTRRETRIQYRIFHLLEKYDAVDHDRSDLDDDALEIRRLSLTAEGLQRGKPLFRLEGFEHIVLIHQRLKDALEADRITGCSYVALDQFRAGLRFYFEEPDE